MKTKSYRAEIFRSSKNRQWYWRLLAPNGKIICASEGYLRLGMAKKSLESTIEHIREHAVNIFTFAPGKDSTETIL